MQDYIYERLAVRLSSAEYKAEVELHGLLPPQAGVVDQGIIYHFNVAGDAIAWRPATEPAQALALLEQYAPAVGLHVMPPALSGNGWRIVFLHPLDPIELVKGEGHSFPLALCQALIAYLKIGKTV